MGLTTSGEVYVWGNNEEGQLGLGDTSKEVQMKYRELQEKYMTQK